MILHVRVNAKKSKVNYTQDLNIFIHRKAVPKISKIAQGSINTNPKEPILSLCIVTGL